MIPLKITIGITASLLIGTVAYDDLTLTDTEINEIRQEINFTADEDFIYKTILLDRKKVEFDLSVITKKEVDDMLLSVMLKLGDTQESLGKEIIKNGSINFDERIAKKSKILTSMIR